MKSVRFHGPKDIRVEEIEEPTCGNGEVKLRPAFVGICGSDLHEYSCGPLLIPQKPHPITGSIYPVTMGHEFAGVVEEVGAGVTRVSRGQRVVVRPTIFDRECPSCKLGYWHCCKNIGFIGLSGYGGGLARLTVAPEEHFYPIPDNVPLETAALIEPLAVAWHAVNLSLFKEGDSVLIIGGGPVGICILQVLKSRGAKLVMVSELIERRKKVAFDYGAEYVLDPTEINVTEKALELTDGLGVDVVFDAAGVDKALNEAIDACKIHGTIVNVAVWEKNPNVRVNAMMWREVKYIGAALFDEKSFQDVINAIGQGLLKPERMITDKIKMADVVEKGFKPLLSGRDQHCKILVDVQRTI